TGGFFVFKPRFITTCHPVFLLHLVLHPKHCYWLSLRLMIRDAVLTPGKERPEVMVCDRHRPLA
ncbi:hypothetical protein, partial [Klebsiella pneumoniae]|uniref:hypothetical protein n=1 Tax=Klebsiella pneumoniae TaxID=573 RepID=UPI001A95469A